MSDHRELALAAVSWPPRSRSAHPTRTHARGAVDAVGALGDRASMGVELVEDAFAIGRREQIVVALWRGEPTSDRLERSYAAVVRAIERAGRAVAFVKIIEAGAPAPDPSQLPWLARELDDLRERVVATAIVLEERSAQIDGLVDAASTVHSMTRPQRRPLKILSDIDEAIVWLLRRLDLAPTRTSRDEVLAWIERLRSSMPDSTG